ncbi:MAG: hypothetical protein IJ572_02245 [Bacilli bacterium]|nr:hypothetical protein [Bacilli bacterium]
MNKVSKGTTLVEIMVSVMLIAVVLVFIFNILVDLKAEKELSTKRSEDAIERASYTRIIQNDFINYGLKKISSCTSGLICYDFEYNNDLKKRLVIFDTYVVYDDEKWVISTGTYKKNAAKFCYTNVFDNSKITTEMKNDSTVKNYHVLKLIVPVTKNISSNRKYDIELTNISESPVEISGITIKCD